MNPWCFTRDPSSVNALLDFGAQRGVAAERLLHKTALTQTHLGNPSAEVSAVQELRVIENLLRALEHRPGLGLALGLTCNFSVFGLWGYGLVCSPTLGDAVSRALRLLPLTFAYSRIAQQDEGELVRLTFQPPALPTSLQRFVVEREMGAAACLLQEVASPSFQLTAFSLRDGRGRAFARHDHLGQIAGVEPTFHGDSYHLSFERHHLAYKLPKANPVTVAMCEQACQQLIEQRRSRMSMSQFVASFVSGTTLDQRPSLTALAKLINLSERTLKRRLQEEGTTFRALVADGRSGMALELIERGNLNLTEVAERLGYADLSSFSQAFKRWFGRSPRAYLRGGTPRVG